MVDALSFLRDAHIDRVWSTVGVTTTPMFFLLQWEKWMVLHQALPDCFADCSYPITFDLLTSLSPVVCVAFEKLDNVRVVDTCLPLDRKADVHCREIHKVSDSVSDNTTMPL